LKNYSKSLLFGLIALVLVTSIPVAFSSSLGDEWSSIKSLLSNAEKTDGLTESLSHVNDAHLIYVDSFKLAASEVDSESDILIENAFDDIIENHTEEDSEMASLNRQIIDKTILKIAYLKIEQSLDQKDTESFFNWFTIMEKKFKISEKESVTINHALDEIDESIDEIDEYSDVIKKELLGIFKLKTLEELEEAIEAVSKNNIFEAKEKVIEGFYYARTLSPAIDARLDTTPGYEGLMHEMEEAMEIVNSDISGVEMKPQLEHVLHEVEILISEYEGQDTSSLGLALSGIESRLNLIEAEYSNAVKNGEIIDQEEYDEAIVFLSKAIEIFNENKQSFMELSDSDTSSLEKNFDELNQIVTVKDNPNQVSILVGKSINVISTLEDLAGGSDQIDTVEYIIEIERLLNQAKDEYHSGNSQLAFDLVSEAYLDNYEFVEGPLGEVDHDLMEKIEYDLREELRSMIQSNVSTDIVDDQIDMILVDLSEAKTVVPEFGSVALLVLLVAVTSIIVLSRKSSLLSLNRI